jgi:2-iminobutanoate/2-iminopropanoate deaminase
MADIQCIRLSEVLSEPLSHYTDAVRGGDTLYISGMLATDCAGSIIGKGDTVLQTEQVFKNIQSVLEYAGTTFANVVKVVVYVRDIQDRRAIDPVRQKFFGEHRPASTMVEIRALAHEDALIEIEAVAYLGKPDN